MPSLNQQVLDEPFTGHLNVTIENHGSMDIEGLGEPLHAIVSQVDNFLGNVSESFNNPGDEEALYEVTSFDRDQAKITVRRISPPN